MRVRIFRPAAVGVAIGLAQLSACGGGDSTPSGGGTAGASATAAACPGGNAELTLPAGFCATVFADSIEHGRHAVVAPNGDLYVTLEGTRPSPEKQISGVAKQERRASFVALRDTNRDGRADLVRRVPGLGNTGIGIYNGYLYVDEGARVVRYARPDTQLVPSGQPQVVVQGIPLNPGHRARNFAIGPDGALYLNIGSATNSCQVKDRGDRSPGVDPCTELETRAGIWRFDANKLNQRVTRASRFATGIRNAMGLIVGPDGKLYATQHGRDQLLTNWGNLFPSAKYSAENPAEELMQVNEGDEFGWPYCYYAVDQGKLVDAPEYGGDGKKTERCASKKGPAAVFPGHWAPMSLAVNSGTAFPERYRNGVFIAFHGSWNRAPEPQAGYQVVYQPFTDRDGGKHETFAHGFAGVPAAQLQPGTAKHRPTGLAMSPDGALYVTDDLGGRIYRISYQGVR